VTGTARAPNLFLRLLKWALRQDENFLTESLAVILELLLSSEKAGTRAAGARIVSALTHDFISVDAESTELLEIRTQVTTTKGRPDLEVRLPDRLAVCEVKLESALRLGQLEGYREYLRTSGFAQTRLILLTKYPPLLPKAAEQPDEIVRWYELADAIECELPELKQADPPCHFLCEQFHAFLKERNMALAQVGWHLSEGTRALHSFLVMLHEAAKGCQVTTKRFFHSIKDIPRYVGFKLDGGKYFLGLDLEDPGKLWFRTQSRIDPEAARQLGEGDVRTDPWAAGQPRWYRAGDLESEEVHFYSRSKVEQIRWLEKFLRESLEMARRIETPDQPPLPPDQPGEE
jgi:hypothetical protein